MAHPLCAIILSATLATNPAPLTTFTRNPVGNRRTSHLSTLHRYEAANRLLEDDQFTDTYDANGNLTSKTTKTLPLQTTTYTYDVENQLIQIALPDGRLARYRYDGLGRRIEKNVSGTLTRFLYDQEDIWLLLNGTTNCATHAFLHGPGIDQPLAFVKDTNADCNPFVDAAGFGEPIVYLQTDGLGSITSLVSETGGFFRSLFLAERYTYDSFGTPTITAPDGTPRATSALGNIYFFTGREFDFESGLYYQRGRYRDPRTGRFLQEDPLNGDDVHPQQQYLYAEGNPVNLVDPGGLQAIAPPIGVGAVCVTSIAGALICAAGAVALVFAVLQATKATKDVVAKGTFCPISKSASSKDFPANPDDWVPPAGVKEELKTKEGSQGKNRQWKDASGKTVRRWDKGEPGKPGNRGRDHWHDPINRPGEHIPPNR